MSSLKYSIILLLFGSCSSNKDLQGTKFSDGHIFISSGSYGFSYSYNFYKKEYDVQFFDHYEEPKTYLIENGTYKLKKGIIHFYPDRKLVCNTNESKHLCFSSFSESFYVSKDTLDEKDLNNLLFIKQEVKLYEKNSNLEFQSKQTLWPMKKINPRIY